LLVKTLENFQGTHILGASRGHLSDSVIFLFSLCFVTKRYIIQLKCLKKLIGSSSTPTLSATMHSVTNWQSGGQHYDANSHQIG